MCFLYVGNLIYALLLNNNYKMDKSMKTKKAFFYKDFKNLKQVHSKITNTINDNLMML